MRAITIAPELHSRSLTSFQLSRRALNCLLIAGVRTLGQLDGMTYGQIGAIRGVGAETLDEISEFVRGLPGQAIEPDKQDADLLVLDENETADESAVLIHVAPQFRSWRVASLGLPEQASGALRKAGVITLDDLHGRNELELHRLIGMGPKGARSITAAVHALADLPDLSCLVVDEGGRIAPNAPLELLRVLASAKNANEEVSALLTGLNRRDADMIRARWTRHKGHLVILDDIAARYSITRERVRQITDKRDNILEASTLRLPYHSRVVSLVEQAGGAMSSHELIKRATAENLIGDASVLETFESLCGLGLVAKLLYSERYRLWLTERGVRELVELGPLDAFVKLVREGARTELSNTGAIHLKSITSVARFGVRHALGFVFKRDTRFDRVGEYIVPKPTLKSDALRAIFQMLEVTPSLRLDDVIAGLKSTRIRKRGGNLRIQVPPAIVVERIISNCPSLRLRDGVVTSAGESGRSDLSESDRVLIGAIERCGGLARWDEIIESVQRAGYSFATASFLLQRPFVVRVATALYGLRGREIPDDLMRVRLRERRLLRRGCIRNVSYLGGPVGKVIYQMTTFTMQGVLPVPTRLGRLAHSRWRARFPDGREAPLKLSAHLLSPLKPWFDTEHLKVGDLVMATFYFADARIEFDLLS